MNGEQARARRLAVLARMGIAVFVPRAPSAARGAAGCVLVRLDRAKSELGREERQVLVRLLKALGWEGPFREQVPRPGERVVLELALGVPPSGMAERSVAGESVTRLAEDEQARRALWARIRPHLPLPRAPG